jgi:hypothetical protein
MAGIFDYKRYINIFATTQDIKQTFPRDQYSLVWDIDGLGSDGWVCDVDWMTLVVDRIKFVNGEPNFDGSNVIGYFPGSTASVIQTGTTIILPANMYTGQMYPGQDINVPITMVNIKWTKDGRDFQRQLMLIQNWEPGTAIGNPEDDPDFTPIRDSFPITVTFTIDPSTSFTDTTITVIGSATSTEPLPIANTVSTRLVTPQFSDIPNALLTTTNFIDGVFSATFYVGNNFIETEPRQDGIYTILTSTLTTSSYSIVADITRTHDLFLQWQYDRLTGYRAGRTASTTLTINTTRSVTYLGQPLGVSLSANTVNQRLGNASIFTVSHDKVNETDIFGNIVVGGTFVPSDTGIPESITLGSGSFNTNGVFTITQVLATGTYVLQASYGGNIGNDIFKPMYLSTVSNTITHYVEQGREFALTEMLIQEGPDYDYLYAHALDDGRSIAEIGGLVTFYHNGNTIGTSTFVRHAYEWPVPGQITTSSYSLLTAGTYPWPKSPAILGKTWGGAFGNPSWQNNYPYQANSNPEWYRPSNPEYPTFFATFKYNSMELDWPPTRTKINTLGIVGDDMPSVPFNINVQISSTETYTITCYEYIGTTDIPEYPAQNLNIISKYNTNNSVVEDPAEPWATGVFRWNFHTAPNTPNIPPSSPSLLPRYDNDPIRGQLRPNGTRYYSYLRSFEPSPRDTWPVDGGNAYPNAYTGPKRNKAENVKVFKFLPELPEPSIVYHSLDQTPLTAPNVNVSFLSIRNASNTNLETSSTYYGSILYKNYGRKEWITYGVNANLIYNKIYETLVTGNQQPITFVNQLSDSILVYSRSHLATKILPRGTIPTTGTFTATFGGTLDQGVEGYYAEGIPFVHETTSTVVQNDPAQAFRSQYLANEIGVLGGVRINPSLRTFVLTGNPPPSDVVIRTTNWFNDNVYPGSPTTMQPFIKDSHGQFPNIFVIPFNTGTLYNDILEPSETYFPPQLSTKYQKKLGWLNRRAPQGTVQIKLLNQNNTSTVVSTLVSNSLTAWTNTIDIVRVPIGSNQFIDVDPEIHLPSPLRYTSFPYLSYNPSSFDYTVSRLQSLGVNSYTTSTTATITYPVRLDYVPNVEGVKSSQGFFRLVNEVFQTSPSQVDLKTALTFDRGTAILFTSTNAAFLQNPPEQKYLVWSNALDIPWAFNPIVGWQKNLFLGQLGLPRVQYKIRTPRKSNDQPMHWWFQWKVERWSQDNNTLFGSVYTTPISMNNKNIDASKPQEINFLQNGFDQLTRLTIWNSYLEDGILRPDPPDPYGVFIYKVYLVVQNTAVSATPSFSSTPVSWNQVIGSGSYGKITGPISNGLVQNNVEWEYENIYFAISTTNTDGSEQIIYTTNGVL